MKKFHRQPNEDGSITVTTVRTPTISKTFYRVGVMTLRGRKCVAKTGLVFVTAGAVLEEFPYLADDDV